MNKKLIVFTILIAVIGFGILFLVKPEVNVNPPQAVEVKAGNLQELKIAAVGKAVSEGVVSEKYAFKTKDNSVIQVGTERHSPPKPYITLDKWDGEVSLKIRMPFETGDNGTIIGDKVRYSTADNPLVKETDPRVDIDIYPKLADAQHEEGGVEFDTILYEKPAINKIEFALETNGLNFFYQLPLTSEWVVGQKIDGENGIRAISSVTETDVVDDLGRRRIHRPENVVGSYAVYASEEKINYEGGKLYRTGQMGMIYRPKIIDSAGTEIWGVLNVDQDAGILSVEIPQKFLDEAVYPVTVDPDFGYTTAGGTSFTIWNDDNTGKATGHRGFGTYTPTFVGGAVTKFSFYTFRASETHYLDLAVYTASGSPTRPDTRVGSATTVTIGTVNPAAWKDSQAANIPLTNGVNYVAVYGNPNTNVDLYYNDAGGSYSRYEADGWTLPTTFIEDNWGSSINISFFATYTPPAAINLDGGINLQNINFSQ